MKTQNPAPAEKPLRFPIMSVFSRAMKRRDPAIAGPADAKASHSRVRAVLSNFGKGELLAAQAVIATLSAEKLQLAARIEALELEAARKNAAADSLREIEVSRQVRQALCTLGVSMEDAPSQIPGGNTREEIIEKFISLEGAEKHAYFQTHKDVLMG